jgi:tripartite-type tricarboxylate transporter receptor subunit TctC
MNSLLGTKFKVVAGYTGSNEVSLAMEKGEIEANAAYSVVTLLSQRPDLLRDKKLAVLFAVSLERHPAFPDVPAIGEMGTTPEAKAVFRLLASSTDIGRTVIAPPGVPDERVMLLRRSFDALMADPEFLADAKKRGLDIEPMPGEKVAAIVREVLAQPADVIERTRELAKK